MACLYVIVSETHTRTGRFIRFMTKEKYNHVSIALAPSLQPMYSFSRYYLNCPFTGGFTEEPWLRYQYHNPYLNIAVYKIEISDEQRTQILDYLEVLENHQNSFRYSLLGAANCYLQKFNYQPQKKYTCLGFAVKVLKEINVLSEEEQIFRIAKLQEKLDRYPHYFKQIQFDQMKKLRWGKGSLFS